MTSLHSGHAGLESTTAASMRAKMSGGLRQRVDLLVDMFVGPIQLIVGDRLA